ncbi:acyltransferase family protein [Dyella lutea]|uniref:Acyltransferase n=1 Tax=Dyella lutea TaxID=2950441 RepID=A0ABT1FF95_9GAMM|nr:acyltransferase [Dyella lutea]MCP1376057.1 acyltransferase [Dyella lutea]
MTNYSIWPSIALIGLCVAMLSVRRRNGFARSPGLSTDGRLEVLDGLRAFLALGVFFHHMSIRRGAVATGVVALPPSTFYAMIGPGSVCLFFMITGYLFWLRIIDSTQGIAWRRIYVNRFFRIVPLYLVAVFGYFIVVLLRARFQTSQPATQTASQIAQWLSFGILSRADPFLGDRNSLSAIGATWSLHYEWLFYFSLPMLWVASKIAKHLSVVLSAIALLSILWRLIGQPECYFIAHFLAGMLACSLIKVAPKIRGDGPARSALAICLLLGAGLAGPQTYDWTVAVLLGAFFMLVASGTSLFGLLSTRGAQRLGKASYSIYLLHGLVLTVVLSPRVLGNFAVQSPYAFWITGAICTMLLIPLSMVSYTFVEEPGIRLGKRICRLLPDVNGPSNAMNLLPPGH